MKFKVLWIAGLMLAATAGQVQAAFLYGTTGNNTTLSDLYSVDATTGTTSLIGAIGYTINGLDYYGGTLYGTERAGGNLIKIDTTTGAGTVIGPLGSFGSERPTELAIDSSGNAYSWLEPGSDDLLSINLTTGAATYVGDSGLGTAAHGMAFSGSSLYFHNFTGDTYTINTGTGTVSLVGNTGVTAHHGDVNPDNGLYYGLGANGRSSTINIINLATATHLGSITADRSDLHTLAFVDSAAVPEPASLAMWSLGGLGMMIARRKRQKKNLTA